ncbi:hypothetical protein C0993_012165 [Termitomyces sp. T159_Od127]|nr:hypothetical protein C0993_012165 [Termitomyces sp. T159_Od127]
MTVGLPRFCLASLVFSSADADDVKNVDLHKVHNLSGPIGVEGAEPGDCLVIEILDGKSLKDRIALARLIWTTTEFDSKAAKAIWDLEGVYATSRHIPGIRFAGITHPGILGTAPSAELLAQWNERETGLVARSPGAVPPVAYLPDPQGVYIGQDIAEEVRAKIASEGARTIPGREHGGNCDPSPVDPQYAQQVVFEGISADVHGDGKQYSMDATVAYKQAALNAITYLGKIGYSKIVSHLTFGDMVCNILSAREQAYLLLSAAPIESHVGAIVDSPNACVTIGIPIAIFDQDILPKPEGLMKHNYGQCAMRSDLVI